MKELRDFYKDNKPSIIATVLFSLVFITVSLFLSAQTDITQNIMFYLTALFIIIIIVAVLEWIAEKKLRIPNANFFGTSKNNVYISLFLGIFLAFILGLASRSGMSILGFDLFLPTESLTAFGNLGNFLAGWIAPFGEELFFRGILFPTIAIIFYISLKNKTKMALPVAVVFALFVSSYIFGVFHFNVFLNQTGFNIVLSHDYISMAVLFSMVWILLMIHFRSIAVAIAFHFVNNNFALGYSIQEIFANIIVFTVLFALVTELSYKFKKR